jgi:crotonobetainyl-CoA:carnitine CoA-transferase CaiB-like acyl-CoA transferase
MVALDGVRVIDLGQFYFGPYCSMLLARLGAEVIKVEAPEGDPYRRLPTAYDDGTSVQFRLINSGKRLLRLDLKRPEGRDVLLRLVRESDVLVQNLSPGAMDRFGLGYDTLSAENPRLILASGTGFGSFGPYSGEPGMDLTIQARTAVMSTTGFDDGPPVRTGPSVVDFLGGAHLMGAVLAALYQREHTGRGQHVEVALQDAVIPSLSSNIAGFVNSGGQMPQRTGNRNGGLAVAPYNAYRAHDGWISVICPTDAHWNRLRALMNDPEADHERFESMAGRCAEMDAVDAIVARWANTRSKSELRKILVEAGIPAAEVVTLGELMEDPHVQARGVLRTVQDAAGPWLTFGSPLFLSDSPEVAPGRPGPLGADTDSILTGLLGLTSEQVGELRNAGAV